MKFLAKIYTTALKTQLGCGMQPSPNAPFHRLIFFYAIVKSETQKLVCSIQMFEFSVRNTHFYHLPSKACISLIFKHFWSLLTPFLWAESSEYLGEVICLKQRLELLLNWFVFIIFYCLTMWGYFQRLPAGTFSTQQILLYREKVQQTQCFGLIPASNSAPASCSLSPPWWEGPNQKGKSEEICVLK